MPDEPYFEVGSGKEFREKYGLTAQNRPTIRLDPSHVPPQFRGWIQLAERWGIGDDLIREDCVRNAAPEEIRQLLTFGNAYHAVLTEWLAGPEANAQHPTREYVAFTCLSMAWDLAKALNEPHEPEH